MNALLLFLIDWQMTNSVMVTGLVMLLIAVSCNAHVLPPSSLSSHGDVLPTIPYPLHEMSSSMLSPADQQLIECANGAEWCRSIMSSTPPPTFNVRFDTTVGSFTVHVNTSWAPPFAQRLYVLAYLHYFQQSAFYRVLNLNGDTKFVTQWGYRGVPEVDAVWNTKQLSNTTWSVAAVRNYSTLWTFTFLH
jgi:hypothetical protein